LVQLCQPRKIAPGEMRHSNAHYLDGAQSQNLNRYDTKWKNKNTRVGCDGETTTCEITELETLSAREFSLSFSSLPNEALADKASRQVFVEYSSSIRPAIVLENRKLLIKTLGPSYRARNGNQRRTIRDQREKREKKKKSTCKSAFRFPHANQGRRNVAVSKRQTDGQTPNEKDDRVTDIESPERSPLFGLPEIGTCFVMPDLPARRVHKGGPHHVVITAGALGGYLLQLRT